MTEDDWRRLFEAAKDARERAYAPYSNYLVGAALRAQSGEVHASANVENASYGLTICAERNAITKAVVAGVRTFAAMVVVTSSSPGAMPCGACRQFLAEFPPSFPVRAYSLDGAFRATSVSALLPDAFGPSDL